MPSLDAYGGDDDELGDSVCLPRLRTQSGHTYVYVLRHRSYFAHVHLLTRRGVYSRAAFISLSASDCAAFIRGRRLFEGGVYSRKYGSYHLFRLGPAINSAATRLEDCFLSPFMQRLYRAEYIPISLLAIVTKPHQYSNVSVRTIAVLMWFCDNSKKTDWNVFRPL